MGHVDLLPQRTGMWADGHRTFLNDGALLDETQNVELENVERPRHIVLQSLALAVEDNPPPAIGGSMTLGHFIAEQHMGLIQFVCWIWGDGAAGDYYTVELMVNGVAKTSLTRGSGITNGIQVAAAVAADVVKVEPGDSVHIKVTATVGTPISAIDNALSAHFNLVWAENNKAGTDG